MIRHLISFILYLSSVLLSIACSSISSSKIISTSFFDGSNYNDKVVTTTSINVENLTRNLHAVMNQLNYVWAWHAHELMIIIWLFDSSLHSGWILRSSNSKSFDRPTICKMFRLSSLWNTYNGHFEGIVLKYCVE